jgi:hypothetical protein
MIAQSRAIATGMLLSFICGMSWAVARGSMAVAEQESKNGGEFSWRRNRQYNLPLRVAPLPRWHGLPVFKRGPGRPALLTDAIGRHALSRCHGRLTQPQGPGASQRQPFEWLR